jgi:hypothetical protein
VEQPDIEVREPPLPEIPLLRPGPQPWFTKGELPGIIAFLRDGTRVFHTYSSYGRRGDLLLGTYNWLDLTALGRQEDWEQPPDRNDGPPHVMATPPRRIRRLDGTERPLAAEWSRGLEPFAHTNFVGCRAEVFS